ncbi:hypothetical protein FRC00_009944 [Tulasnella sp. 408]|nr:hypothetical protein FRC00_009944 [Tulasnella sp. 408]
MAKATNKTHTDPPPAHTDSKDNRKTTKKSNSKGDSNKVPNPNVKSEAPNSRPKRAVTKSSNQEQHPPAKSQTDSRSRKRQADQANEQPQNTPDTPEAAAELEAQRPTKKSKKATSTGSGEPLSSTTTSNVKGTKKKASSNGSGKAAKENVPPPPAATTSKSKKPTAAERREQQLNAADHSALEQRIKELEAQNADHLRAMERLQRKNKRLNHTATQLASSVADTKTDQVIKEPETAKYSLQDEMGLANDTKTYTRIQASTIGVHFKCFGL